MSTITGFVRLLALWLTIVFAAVQTLILNKHSCEVSNGDHLFSNDETGSPLTGSPLMTDFVIPKAETGNNLTIDNLTIDNDNNSNMNNEETIAQDMTTTAPERRQASNMLGADVIPGSPYAYSFVLGGVNPDKPDYRDYLYGIFVAIYQLRKLGSTADVFLWVEFQSSAENPAFPENERILLEKMGVHVMQLPSMIKPSFYELQLQKFRILGLTQYRRILHLDSDILPLANLDYLFEFSDPQSSNTTQPILEPDFIVLGPNDIANGGFFMLAPKPGDLELIQSIIKEKELKTTQKGYWDKTYGWGKKIRGWVGTQTANEPPQEGWTFFAASGDQGLLYHWVANVKRRFSRTGNKNELERWLPHGDAANPDDVGVYLESNIAWPMKQPKNSLCLHNCGQVMRATFEHFMGNFKPWKMDFDWKDINEGTKTKDRTGRTYWLYTLREMNNLFQAGLELDQLGRERPVKYRVGQWKDGETFTNLFQS